MNYSDSEIAGDNDQENGRVNKVSQFFSKTDAKRKRNDGTEATSSWSSKPESLAVTDEHQPRQNMDRTKHSSVVIDLLDDSETEGSADEAVEEKANQPSESAKEIEPAASSSPLLAMASQNNDETKVLPNVSPSEAAAAAAPLNATNAKSNNPFAQFAFTGASSSFPSSNKIGSSKTPGTSWQQAAKKAKCVHLTSTLNARINNNSIPKTMPDLKSNSSKTNPTKRDNKTNAKAKCGDNFVRMKDLSPEEQAKIVRKWHDMVVDKTASLHDRRFQVLVAARLHARCQEGQVRKAMKELHAHFAAAAGADANTIDSQSSSASSSPLSVQSMAKADPEDFVKAITNLQYHNTKAKQLVLAAKEIKVRHGGKVPETEHSLKQISGIGPVFADLLAFVNTEAKHKETEALAAAEGAIMD